MPELPEVETVRRGLSGLVVGRKIAAVEHDTPKSFPNATADVKEFMIGAKVTDVRRRAKVLLIDLSTAYTLVVHLKMTGQMVFVRIRSAPHPASEQANLRHTPTDATSLQSAELAAAQTSSIGQEVAPVGAGQLDSVPSSGRETDRSASTPARVTRGGAAPTSSMREVGADNGVPAKLASRGGERAARPADSDLRGTAKGSSDDGSGGGGELRFGAGHPNDSLIGELPDKSTRVTITFEDGSHLYFNDQRKFGWMKLLPTVEVPNIDFMKKVGPEPLDADFTAGQFAERFKRRAKTSIKAALLDQTVVAGVGNIYADESLWGAKIHPQRLVGSITTEEFQKLYEELRAVMNKAIEKGGSTDKNYVNAEGKRGSYLDFARVFRREGEPCPRCGTTIIKFKHAGRGTHICPHCQNL